MRTIKTHGTTVASTTENRVPINIRFGVAVPAGTPPDIVSRLRQETIRASDKPKLKEVFASLGAHPVTTTPAEFTRRIAEETRLWKAVIDKAGVKPE